MKIFSYEWIRKNLLSIARYPIECNAILRRNRFACRALQGESSYNITVNSDFTVSCNCTDYYKQGQIGDHHNQSLEEMFHGHQAENLRLKLSKGILPLFQCVLCSDRMTVAKKDAAQYLNNFHLPYKGMMVENTINCNLRCVSCPRESIMEKRTSKRLSLGQVEILAKEFSLFKLQSLAYFNLGEPFMYDTIFDELSIIKGYNHSISIVISTNGTMLNTDVKREAALHLKSICFSIDGSDNKTLVKYQRGSDFELAYKNMKELVNYRNAKKIKEPCIEWKYVLFRWNDKPYMIEKAIYLAEEAGVDKISFWPSFTPPWSFSVRWAMGKFSNIGEPFPHRREVIFKNSQ
jgi:sulfatase maturation enzyme AslB (radical SAM superfamily)